MGISSIAVFCGSQKGKDKLFTTHAQQVGKIIAELKIKLVYGGGNIGLMGIVADAVLQERGEVVGVIPTILDKMERSHTGITELLIVEDMHTRKKKMYELCDAAVILPGGYGTLDELFEMVTWNNLSIHDKQIIILNSNGYYNHLLTHINTMMKYGFLYENPMERIRVIQDPLSLRELLTNA
jgi:uncharacterized protein (TIGR00730 family)